MTVLDEDVAAYAKLAAALADPQVDRAKVLADAGIDEEEWSGIEARWEARLEAEEPADEEGIPPLALQYSEAFAKARQAHAAPLGFEAYVEATRAVQKGGGDMARALEGARVSLDRYLAAHAYWTKRMIEEPELGDRFRAVINAAPRGSGSTGTT
jgi:hypothetical protein